MDIKQYFIDLWKRIIESDNQPLLNRIKTLIAYNITLQYDKDFLEEEIQNKVEIIEDKNDEIIKLREELIEHNKHSSLFNFKSWMEENISSATKRYNYDGTGSQNVCNIFRSSLIHKDLIEDFTATDLGFDGSKYNNSDDLMYAFNVMFEIKFPVKKFYEHDKNNWGRSEYWATVDKIIEKIRTKKRKADDCDGFMTLKYCMLYYLLEHYFPDDLWRLRGFIVDVRTGGGHAMLAWVKESVNDWVPVETTFYISKFKKDWNKDYCIRDQMLYSIRYSFDNHNAYVRI